MTPEWIKPSERLPEDQKDVLLVMEYTEYGIAFVVPVIKREIVIGYVYKGKWYIHGYGGRPEKVIEWMPLPEPSEPL